MKPRLCMSLVLYLAWVMGKTVKEIVNIFVRVFCLTF